MSTTAEPKPSRYRSVRNAASAPEVVPGQETGPAADGGVNRSRSRYHRKPKANVQGPTAAAPTGLAPPPPGPAPTAPGEIPSRQPSNAAQVGPSEPAPVPAGRVLSPQADADRKRRLNDNSASRQAQAGVPRTREAPSRETSESKSKPDSAHRHDSPMFDSSFPTQKPPGSNAPQQIRATTVDTKQEKSAGCFSGLFKRKKPDMVHQPAAKSVESSSDEPKFIKAGGGGVVPGTDAPKSAVNAGQRHILIECNRTPMQFPVDLNTTPADLLASAANVFSEPIDPKTFVLIEYFCKVGIQRPLRRYERVRDTMNSWDDDKQNSLMVVPAAEAGSDPNLLQVSMVAQHRPAEKSHVMFYSQKVGKWDRRRIYIKPDGSITAKKSGSAPDKDAVNICHLSDFDIYTPTVRQSAKKVKPPKKICFAIKSQQKTSMFETTTNFVHFFCTDDKEDAINFYTNVQKWRSWYLVNKMGEGRKPSATTADAPATRGQPVRSTTGGSTGSGTLARDPSSGSMGSRYQLGTFQPLVDTDKIAFRPSMSQEKEVVPAEGEASGSSPRRDRTYPPPSLPQPQELDGQPLVNKARKRSSVDAGGSGVSQDSSAFASNGLLGRTYSQRQREAASRDATTAQPFTNGQTLVNGDNTLRHQVSDTGLGRNTSVRDSGPRVPAPTASPVRRQESQSHRRGPSADVSRNSSTRAPVKPLVDLTPSYKEPPQHQRKGRGVTPNSTTNTGGLIDSVPSPENALGIPSSTDWRGRNATRDLHSASSGDSRARSSSHNRVAVPPSPAPAPTGAAPQAPRFQNTQAYAALTQGPDTAAPMPPAVSPMDRSRVSGAGMLSDVGGGGRQSGLNGKGKDSEAFVAGGLLEHADRGWGAGDKGRGVATGASAERSGRPLVDLNEASQYAPGSLLARQEKAEGL